MVRGRSIYGFHLKPQLFVRINLYVSTERVRCSYRWEDVVKLARIIVEGQLPKPFQPAVVEKKECFPPLLAYEHKYNYKLKFLTDYNVMIFHPLTVTNLVVRMTTLSDVVAFR